MCQYNVFSAICTTMAISYVSVSNFAAISAIIAILYMYHYQFSSVLYAIRDIFHTSVLCYICATRNHSHLLCVSLILLHATRNHGHLLCLSVSIFLRAMRDHFLFHHNQLPAIMAILYVNYAMRYYARPESVSIFSIVHALCDINGTHKLPEIFNTICA